MSYHVNERCGVSSGHGQDHPQDGHLAPDCLVLHVWGVEDDGDVVDIDMTITSLVVDTLSMQVPVVSVSACETRRNPNLQKPANTNGCFSW